MVSPMPAITKEGCVSCFLVLRAAHQRAKSHETHTSGPRGRRERPGTASVAHQGFNSSCFRKAWAGLAARSTSACSLPPRSKDRCAAVPGRGAHAAGWVREPPCAARELPAGAGSCWLLPGLYSPGLTAEKVPASHLDLILQLICWVFWGWEENRLNIFCHADFVTGWASWCNPKNNPNGVFCLL